MSEVTRIIQEIQDGNLTAANDLLPLVYSELKRLAAEKLRHEKPGQTLQPTALVHEAYLRLVGELDQGWNGRGHFFGAAAEAMRRILIEYARRKKSAKRGGDLERYEIDEADAIETGRDVEEVLDLDEALTKLEAFDSDLARLVKLRYFAGMTIDEAAEAMGVSPRTIKRNWTYARAWLGRELEGNNFAV